MKRIEMFFSQAVEEDILNVLKPIPEAQFFTLIPNVKGRGYSMPKMGDSVWPEFNEVMIIYCEEEKTATLIAETVEKLRERYPTEGISIFIT
ncbi:hypothetical protein K7I13_11175 [Brucepastera parasyntrophica]|uniref:PG0541 family transporter-associated protein n=1 Tax=Brucepastera parasyntrophica TaxID=2880008 RepID=UPI00210EFF4D|nr:PG0541 family transporter-associated protein [Brucepastera parasyntrophica]ULQ59067.1 hypothetical protein K7I13_11175 [Brucepastera parasyntrophica]